MENKGSEPFKEEPFKSMIDYINCRQNQLEVLDKKIIETELSDKEFHEDLKIRRDCAFMEINGLHCLNHNLLAEAQAIIDKFKNRFFESLKSDSLSSGELVENLCKDFLKIFGYKED